MGHFIDTCIMSNILIYLVTLKRKTVSDSPARIIELEIHTQTTNTKQQIITEQTSDLVGTHLCRFFVHQSNWR